jgi:hypothetical protein
MSTPARCLVVVPGAMAELHGRLVVAFADDPRVFVLQDRRTGAGALRSVGIFAVGGGDVDPVLRLDVENKLLALGVRP